MMESEDLNRLFYGEEASIKINQFTEGLSEIEEKYSQYFIEKNKKSDTDEKDRLHNHYIMITNPHNVLFNFLADSDLDEKIKQECRELFKRVFNN